MQALFCEEEKPVLEMIIKIIYYKKILQEGAENSQGMRCKRKMGFIF